MVQAGSANHLAGILNFGALLFSRSDGSYRELRQPNYQQIAMQPHLAGTTRGMATRQTGSWIASLYLYQRPRLGFSRSEQRLLLAARDSKTDEELSDALGISLSAVKNVLRGIYARVTDGLPDLIPNAQSEEATAQDRGKEKRWHLIAHLREHPEELRPFSRKLLQEEVAKSRRSLASGSKFTFALSLDLPEPCIHRDKCPECTAEGSRSSESGCGRIAAVNIRTEELH